MFPDGLESWNMSKKNDFAGLIVDIVAGDCVVNESPELDPELASGLGLGLGVEIGIAKSGS